MGFNDFWINNNQKKSISKNDFNKTVNKEMFSGKSLSLFLRLDSDGNGKLEHSELASIYDKLVEFANSDGDNELNDIEALQFIQQKDSETNIGINNSLQTLQEQGISASDLKQFIEEITKANDKSGENTLKKFNTQAEAKEIQPTKKPTEEETKEFTVKNLRAMYDILKDSAIQTFDDRTNEYKETAFLLKMIRSKDPQKRAAAIKYHIELQEKYIDFLEKAASKEGLSFQEYYNFKKDCLKSVLYASGYTNNDLESRLNSLTLETISQWLQEDNPNNLRDMFFMNTQLTITNENIIKDGETFTYTSDAKVKIKPPAYNTKNLDEKIPFEKVFKDIQGIEYNPDEINHFLAA